MYFEGNSPFYKYITAYYDFALEWPNNYAVYK